MGVGEFVDEYRTAAVEFVTGFIDHLISSDDGGCVFAFYFVLSRTVWSSVRLVIVGGLFTIQLLRLDNNAIFSNVIIAARKCRQTMNANLCKANR